MLLAIIMADWEVVIIRPIAKTMEIGIHLMTVVYHKSINML